MSRRGTGVVLWIALGIVIVVGILLGAQYTMGRSSRQEAAAAYLGTRASTVLESCLDEATYRAFGEAAGRGTRRELGEALRMYVPPAKPSDRKKPDRDGWLARFDVPVPLTTEAYRASPDVEIAGTRYGIIEQEHYPSAVGLRTNESRGLVAVEADVELTLPGAGLKIGRKGRQELEYKTIVVGLPWPFNRYTFFDRCDLTGGVASSPATTSTSDALSAVDIKDCGAIRDRFYALLCEWNKKRAAGKTGDTDFPVEAMDPKAKPADGGASNPATIPATGPVYAVSGHIGDDGTGGGKGWDIPDFHGDKSLDDQPDDPLNSLLAMSANQFRKASATEAGKLDAYYGQLEEPAWLEKRTHVFHDLSQFIAATSRDGVLELAGVYWIDGPVAIAHEYRGHGVIVTPHPDGIVVRKAKKSDEFDGHLTLVATRGDVRAQGNPAELHASLAAVHGTVHGLGHTKIYGTVYVDYLPSDREEGPEIQKPFDADWDPVAKPDDEPAEGLARRMRAFLVPRPVRRDFTVSRGRM